MSQPLVRALCRDGVFGVSLSNVGLRGGAVPDRKVPLVGLIAAAPRWYSACLGAPFLVPAVSRLHNRNTRAPSPRIPSIIPWNTTRHCSSHASSSLVEMATDRDILSDEYASPPAFMPHLTMELGIANNFFLAVSSRPTMTSLSSISSLTRPGHTKVALQSTLP